MSYNDFSNSMLQSSGQASSLSSMGGSKGKMVFTGIVVPNGNKDPMGMNRIRVRIIALDETGNIKGKKTNQDENYNSYSGKDAGIIDDKLPLALPLLPEFIHIRPRVGEMVYIFIENPDDVTSPRFWLGPVINSQLKLNFQSYEESAKIYEYNTGVVNKTITDEVYNNLAFPGEFDISIQGREDSDLVLKSRELILSAGKFEQGTFKKNVSSPCNVQLKQFSNSIVDKKDKIDKYSQANITSTNVNLYSSIGKFRNKETKDYEKNDFLEIFGELSDSLHPLPFGDELIKLLDIIIRLLLSHIHTPQKPLLSNELSKLLQEYTIDGKLQDIISKFVRIN